MSEPLSLGDLQVKLHEAYTPGEKSPDLNLVKGLLVSYKSNPRDWKKYVTWNDSRYTRTLVDVGNGQFNLIILCWAPSQGSPIHDHSGSNCFVKILDGKLQETLFKLPQGDDGQSEEIHEMERVGEPMVFSKDQVTFINDDQGVAHRMENPSHTDGCVTLHLYTPPYSSCHKFDDRTSEQITCTMSYDQNFSAEAPSCQGDHKDEAKTCCGNK